MYKQYKNHKFRPSTLELIEKAEAIIQEYAEQGYTLTLRQLYYQFVSLNAIENSERSYKRLGNTITKAREAGILSWTSIEDRNRTAHRPYVEESVQRILNDLPYEFHADFWADQPYYIEVWVEKEALGNVLERACQKWKLPRMACKGYLSASEAWRAGQRFQQAIAEGKETLLIHLGDHDPSGLDMTRDNQERASLFAEDFVGVNRLALNMEQVTRYRPPPNPTKVTDSRAADYMQRYGETSWELDALKPQVIVDLVNDAVTPLIDMEAWDAAQDKQDHNRELLSGVGDHWEEIKDMISDGA
jgi:hypothetical protein